MTNREAIKELVGTFTFTTICLIIVGAILEILT